MFEVFISRCSRYFAISLFFLLHFEGDPSWDAKAEVGSLRPNEFVNPIGEGADPWVIRDPHQPRYLWCMSEGNQAIAIHVVIPSLQWVRKRWSGKHQRMDLIQKRSGHLNFISWRVNGESISPLQMGRTKSSAYVLTAVGEDPLVTTT